MPLGRLVRAPAIVTGWVASALTGAYAAGKASPAPTVAAGPPAPAEVADDPLVKANDRIRDAAKWLIGSASAVGAVLIAGSQLSSVGKLDAQWPPSSVDRARLYIAGAGVLLALCGIAYVIWRAVQLFLPVEVTLTELDEAWTDRKKHKALRPVVAFFTTNLTYLQGMTDPADLRNRQARAQKDLQAKDASVRSAANARLVQLNARESAILTMAQYRLLLARFKSLVTRLVPATAVVAVGIVCFAWAANPSTPSSSVDLRSANLSNADLQGVDLSGARLDGANLTGADLRDADLRGTSLTNVVWSHTTCPDNTNSDAHGHTCLGHLIS